MVTILIFFLLLSVLILVHELGHFFAARKLGVTAEEFGLGLPPRVRRLFIWKGTEFTLNWLPIGGFVRMRGEDREDQKGLNLNGAFYAQKPWKRAVILAAGVTMNALLGIAAFTAVYTSLGIPEKSDKVMIEAVASGSPAERAQLRQGDIVREFRVQDSGFRINETKQFVELVNKHRGEEIILTVDRKIKDAEESESLEVSVTPRLESETPENEGALGVAISNLEFVHYPWWQMPFRASVVGVQEAAGWGRQIINGILQMFRELVWFGKLPHDIAGPIGIAKITGRIAQQGWIPLVQFTGILSINLAIVNALPIPALDGGRLLFLGIEKLRGKPLDPNKERLAHLIGYTLLISLLILITIKDLIGGVAGLK